MDPSTAQKLLQQRHSLTSSTDTTSVKSLQQYKSSPSLHQPSNDHSQPLQKSNSTSALSSPSSTFQNTVKRFYYQLVTGCGNNLCQHRLCRSCIDGPKIERGVCLVLAVQLASKPNRSLLLCNACPAMPTIHLTGTSEEGEVRASTSLPNSPKIRSMNHRIRPFYHYMLSSTAFTSLFSNSEDMSQELTQIKNHDSVKIKEKKGFMGGTFMDVVKALDFSHLFSQRTMSSTASSESVSSSLESLKIADKEKMDSRMYVLSSTLLRTLISRNPTQVQHVVETVFSNSHLLNASFLSSSSKHPSGIDFTSLQETFQILQTLPHIQFLKSIDTLLTHLTRRVIKLYTAPNSNLRQLVILLECEILDVPLFKKLVRIVGNIHGPAKQTLINWFSHYEVSRYKRLVFLFQSYIVEHFHPLNRHDVSQHSALNFLRLLFESNLISGTLLFKISDFYVKGLSEKINFKEEYKNWTLPHVRSKTDVQEQKFSYLNFGFLLDPVSKTRIMHIDAMVQMSHQFEDAFVHQALVIHTQRFLHDSSSASSMERGLRNAANPFLVLEVERGRIVECVLDQVLKKAADLKKPLKVRFVGGGEEGQDQGGVQKEFFQVLMDELMDPGFGMFTYDEETRFFWINGASLEHTLQFELVGTIIALALYNGVILGVHFPTLFYKKLLGEKIEFEDVKQAFPALGNGLQQLLHWEDGDVSDVFMRTFEISYNIYGKVYNYPLMQNGAEELVTNANRKEYVKKYIHHLTDTFVSKQFSSFKKGFYKVVGGRALHLCNAEELELLVCGAKPNDLDFKDLENATLYDDGYSAGHHVIEWFWSIVHELTFIQKQSLLMFVTASDRIPLKGLGQLTFVIQRNGSDSDRLPTALTCFGRLLLPEYSDYQKLKNRLLTAIENAKGFGLV